MTDKNKAKSDATADAPTTALAVIGDQEYMVLSHDAGDLAMVLAENMGPQGIDVFALDRVPMPSGGAPVFQVPTLEGDQTVKYIDGVIIHHQMIRGYYDTAYDGSKNPPVCSSNDGETGKGEPGGSCAECPLAEFGSGMNADGSASRGQACSQRLRLFLLTPDSMLPLVITLPPTSLKPARKHLMRLAGKGLPFYQVVTRVGLTSEKSGGGIEYSAAALSVAAMLSPEQRTAFTALRETFKPQLLTVELSSADFRDATPGATDESTE